MIDRLPLLNKALAIDVGKVLAENKAERHIRGGMATKLKYIHEKEGPEILRKVDWKRKLNINKSK